ncbi:protocadherin alpha-3-like [Scomber scombrus]|uniref:Protocadherin alpha-3-like n=1 Tax=Scomber scombrus TaxID=13677 RepID=A0AAV1NBN6_SCOSC
MAVTDITGKWLHVWIFFCPALLIITHLEGISAQIRYSILEESKSGTAVGHVAKDLGLDLGRLADRNLRVISGTKQDLFKEKQIYEIKVLAADKGVVSLSTHCNVVVRVEDVNDNQPEIDITSLSSHIPEDAPPGTVVALVGVTDRDSGVNGQVVCSVPGHLPFDLKPSPDGQSYSLVTKDNLDKETIHMYNITITAKDLGTPPLSSTKVIKVDVLDVNDNNPLFTESPYTFYVLENNKPGTSVFSCSKSTDYSSKYLQDANYDGTLCHSIQYRSGDKRYMLVGPRMSIGSTIVPGSHANTLVHPNRRQASEECSKTTEYTSKYLQDTNYDGTLCHSIQYRSGDKRYMLVGPRMSIGSTIVPGSHANTLMLPDRRRASEECSKTTDYTSKYLQDTNYDGTLCHSIQYRSGDKRYMLVGPRMSIGSTIVPGSHANTLVLPDRRVTSGEFCKHSTKVIGASADSHGH